MKELIFLITVSLFTLHATASDFVVKGISYKIISPTEVAVTGSEKQCSGTVRIHEKVVYESQTYTVSEIGKNAFAAFVKITEVILPGTIKTIGENAFASCFSLKKYNIPNSVEYIGALAFNNCTAPDTIRISENVRYIGKNAFGASNNLKWIEVKHFNPNYISVDGVLFNSTQTEIVSFPAGRERHYSIPVTITHIEESIFANSRLSSVKIPYGVMSIGKQAFYHCSKLQTVDIPPSVIFIKEQAFANCTSLKNISIPASVKDIAKEAFLQCTSLDSIDIPASIFIVNERVFAYCTSLENVDIRSATVRVVDKLAFSYCTNLKELTLPSTVLHIGHGAFYPCKKLSIIRVHHIAPLKLNGYVFADVDKKKCQVFVPTNSVEKYKEAAEWKGFRNFIATNYRFTVSFSQPQNGRLQILTDSTVIESGTEFAQNTEFTLSLSCEEGYEFEKFVINGIALDALPPMFILMDETKIEVKLKPVEKRKMGNIFLSHKITSPAASSPQT